MIFLTVGVQLPHDRLLQALDEWALGRSHAVVAQAGRSQYRTRAITRVHEQLPMDEYWELLEACTHVVAHAGVGSILTARHARKPILLLPRRADLGEHRSDHQLATARKLQDRSGVVVCGDHQRFAESMEELLSIPSPLPLEATESGSLLDLRGGLKHWCQTGSLADWEPMGDGRG